MIACAAVVLQHSLLWTVAAGIVAPWALVMLLHFSRTAFFFLTVSEPGAIVPSHEHKRDLFRIVVSGSIITNGIELKSGDWMFVPKGVSYGYSAALAFILFAVILLLTVVQNRLAGRRVVYD